MEIASFVFETSPSPTCASINSRTLSAVVFEGVKDASINNRTFIFEGVNKQL